MCLNADLVRCARHEGVCFLSGCCESPKGHVGGLMRDPSIAPLPPAGICTPPSKSKVASDIASRLDIPPSNVNR